jgi:DNA-binding NarL/FixJ family response regulator
MLQIGGTLFPNDGAGRSIAMPLRLGNLVKLFVLDPHTIYRRGLAASLELMPDVDSVAHAGSIGEAHAELADADLVLLDPAAGPGLVAELGPPVLVCASSTSEDAVLEAMRAGALGYLRKDALTPESLAAAVRATVSGNRVMAPELLGNLLDSVSLERDRPVGVQLTDREQQVLSLIAAGHATREVAEQLCYSERTVKNVLHDVVTKLNARSRSQAIAFAVREGLI